MRQAYIVSYDISDPKRLRRVFRVMKGYGDHLQLSVFRCELDQRELIELRTKLTNAIHHEHDQVLFVDMGPAEGRGLSAIRFLGRPYRPPSRSPLVF